MTSRRLNRGRALPRWLIAILAVIVIIGACEVAGWPFLVSPLQSQLSKALQREVSFAATPDGERGRTRIHLLGRIRLAAENFRIGAAPWSKDPYFVQARNVELSIPYAAIWQAMHNEKIHIVRLGADELNVMAERQKDGKASWQFGDQPDPAPKSDKKFEIPSFDSLIVRDGKVVYRDAPLDLDLDSTIHTIEGDKQTAGQTAAAPASGASDSTASAPSDADAKGLVITTKGHYKKGTFDGRVSASGALPLLGGSKEVVPIAINFKSSQTSFSFKGQAANALALDGITGEFKFRGPSLGDISDLLNVTLPTTPAFDLVGKIRQQTDLWDVLIDNAVIGSSRLQAQMQYDTRGSKPVLQGKLIGQKVLLADLAPSIGGDSPAPEAQPAKPAKPAKKDPDGRALPDREFDLPSLQVMNANITVSVDNFELGRVFAEPLTPLKAVLVLKDGVLSINDLDAQTAGGRLRGGISLDGNGGTAKWKTDLRWSDVEMSRWLKQARSGDKPPYLTGKLDGRAVLSGEGKSTGKILGTLNGSMGTSLRDGSISQLIVEAAGLDIAQALGMLVKGDDALPVSCGIADFRAEKGVLFPKAVIIDTPDSSIFVDGTVSLAAEKLDLRAVVDPKDKSPLTLRTPVRVGGTFESPKVSLEASKLAPRAGAAALLALVNPIAAVIPFIDLGDGNKPSGCEEFMKRHANDPTVKAMKGPQASAAK